MVPPKPMVADSSIASLSMNPHILEASRNPLGSDRMSDSVAGGQASQDLGAVDSWIAADIVRKNRSQQEAKWKQRLQMNS
jgi:hypothetical protein